MLSTQTRPSRSCALSVWLSRHSPSFRDSTPSISLKVRRLMPEAWSPNSARPKPTSFRTPSPTLSRTVPTAPSCRWPCSLRPPASGPTSPARTSASPLPSCSITKCTARLRPKHALEPTRRFQAVSRPTTPAPWPSCSTAVRWACPSWRCRPKP